MARSRAALSLASYRQALVTVVPDVSEVNVKAFEYSFVALIVECGGLAFGEFGGFSFHPGFKVCGLAFNCYCDL